MNDRFTRIRALVGADGFERLQNSTVMVVGCGAVGSMAIEALARSGIGRLIIVDFDTVDISNINRQLIALSSTVGAKKVDIAAARVRDINPDIDVIALDMFFDGATMLEYKPDFVIDAIDTLESKIALYRWCRANDVPFAASMGAALKSDPGQVRVGTILKTSVCPLAARVRKIVRNSDIGDFPVVFSTEVANKSAAAPGRVFGSMMMVTGVFGLMLANIAVGTIMDGVSGNAQTSGAL